MGTPTHPQPYQKEQQKHRWPEVFYLAVVAVSIAGLAYIFLKG
jgi:hypothetical protein